MLFRNATDESLVMLTLMGEQDAYEVLVKRYQKSAIASAYSVTKTQFMAEDAAQDAFVTAWMKLDTLQEPSKFSSWVCCIARNCALNMINRYRSFIPLETVDNLDITDDGAGNPAEQYMQDEEQREVDDSITALPEKVRTVIQLYYFENLSIAEIADRMRISEGTVKRQLHDGRKKIRKELCAMNEKYSDTLVQRVMKKVEELKLWQVKNSKSGFEKVYREVLDEVEELPECKEKQHALADVLMRGWWWLPGKKNDALFARISEAALKGKNEDVMAFICAREDSLVDVDNSERINFIRDKQIPRLEKAGFVKALGQEWFWLGYNLCGDDRFDEGRAAFDKVNEILGNGDSYRHLVPYALRMEDELAGRYKDIPDERYKIAAFAEEYRIIDNGLRYWSDESFSEGYISSVSSDACRIFRNAFACDGSFRADIQVGETYEGSDGSKLKYVSDCETVGTPAGKYCNCQLWEVRRWTEDGKAVCRTWYSEGTGIVRQDYTTDGITETKLLKSCEIKGGTGLFPVFNGNTWEYTTDIPEEYIFSELKYTVSYADDKKVIISVWNNMQRLKYNPDSWIDAAMEIANDYYYYDDKGNCCIRDITPAIERAGRLAVTPMEKIHTKVAASVAKRIMATDKKFNPDYTATGDWIFFTRNNIYKNSIYDNNCSSRFEFQLKNTISTISEPLLFNDILGILQGGTNCLWSDEWCIGAEPDIEYTVWGYDVKSKITCENGGTVKTAAGTFDKCFKLRFDVRGMDNDLGHYMGEKTYYFAEGIGIVRTENEYCRGEQKAVYELTSYEGTGKGYMPVGDGFFRRYEAIGLTDGYAASTEYTFVADEDGDIVVFGDQAGIHENPRPAIRYSSILGEQIEQQIWKEKETRWEEGHMKYAANNFHLFLHMFARPGLHHGNPQRSAGLMSFYMQMMEQLGEDGKVPEAWCGMYAYLSLIRAAALFADNRAEEGFAALSTVLDYCEKVSEFKTGELLNTGKAEVMGNVKYKYGKRVIVLPDGQKEMALEDNHLTFNASKAYTALTKRGSWAWFDSVRDTDRYKECIARAKKLMKK